MRHLIRRVGFYLVALWASATLNFFIPRLAPGNPAQALLARMHGRVSPAALHTLEVQYGVSNESLFSQYRSISIICCTPIWARHSPTPSR